MAFTYDVSTDRGLVRLQLSDTDSAAYWFEDAEIDALLSKGGSVDAATGLGARALLASKTLRSKKFSLPGMSYDDTATVAELRALVEMYGAGTSAVGVVMPALHPYDSGFVEPATSS